MAEKILQFAPFSSAIDAGFWFELTKRKLDVYKLDDSPVPIKAFYSNRGSKGLPPIANIDYSAFQDGSSSIDISMKATLLNTNTLEDFKKKDKKELLYSVGKQIWESITSGDALKDPSSLQVLLCFTFAELKSYHYYYWVCFPALVYPKVTCHDTIPITEYLTKQQLDNFSEFSKSAGSFFLLQKDVDNCSPISPEMYKPEEGQQVALVFSDPSSLDRYPGWPLRNILALAAYHWGGGERDVICLRMPVQRSIVLRLSLEETDRPRDDCPDVVGWERHKEKLAPRKVDMSQSMQPDKLCECAVDLNLQLMRWRLEPQLPLELIRSRKCLLIGAGTLGCSVARTLLGWGVRHVTLVDNGRVSASNPVRQSLFQFDDCGRQKATAAADALKRIFPGAQATGEVLSIPMPAHSVSETELPSVRDSVSRLESLVSSHDILFLLTDTRESRWLPTMLAKQHQKLALTAALGFDSYLVMRHGPPVGCYFCNDVVAPGNSLRDRTLDQQCTVTRPGLSYIAGGLVVELMVTILQNQMNPLEDEVPHQIRGRHFQSSLFTTPAFDSCIACSEKVLSAYKEGGFEFLLKVFGDSEHLEKLTGLTELLANIDMGEIVELSDEESI